MDTKADCLNRVALLEHECALNLKYLQPIFHAFGHPYVDAFAIRENTKCPLCFSEDLSVLNSLGDGFLQT